MEIELFASGSDWGEENWIYQQDGAAIHTAQTVKNGLMTMMFKFCPGQPKVQISILSRMFGAMLVEGIYGDGRQYEYDVKELKESLDSVRNTFCQTKTL